MEDCIILVDGIVSNGNLLRSLTCEPDSSGEHEVHSSLGDEIIRYLLVVATRPAQGLRRLEK